MSKRKIISIHGAYYSGNFGDHLLIRMLVDWVREINPYIHINLPDCPLHNKDLLGADSVGREFFERSDALIYSGGGYFGEPPENVDQWSVRNYSRYVKLGLDAIAMNIPICICGVGVGPVSDHLFRYGLISIFNYSNHTTVRDSESLDYLKEYGAEIDRIKITADSALNLSSLLSDQEFVNIIEQNRDRLKSESNTKICALHFPITTKTSEYNKVSRQFVNWQAKEKIAHQWKVVQFTDSTVGRRFPVKPRIKHLLNRRNAPFHLYIHNSIDAIVQFVASCDWIVTSKLHIGIVAISLDIPVLSLPAHHKTIRFYDQIGLSEMCCPLSDIRSLNVQDYSKKLNVRPSRIEDVRELAFENFKLVEQFVNLIFR